MPKIVHFGEFLKTWSLRSNSVTRQVTFNRTKIDGKCQNKKNSNATFWVIFKHCDKAEVWKKATAFYDLADFLTFKATGSQVRSLCSLVCKWTYRGLADENGPEGFDKSFFQSIGLQVNVYMREKEQCLPFLLLLFRPVQDSFKKVSRYRYF